MESGATKQQRARDHFDIAVFGINVTDTKYRAYSQIDCYSTRQTWGDPAMVGISLTVRY